MKFSKKVVVEDKSLAMKLRMMDPKKFEKALRIGLYHLDYREKMNKKRKEILRNATIRGIMDKLKKDFPGGLPGLTN